MAETMERITGEVVHRWFRHAAVAIHEQRDYLSQLDAAIGDADHGANMERGFSTVATMLEHGESGSALGPLLKAAGDTLISSAGGASGALWGSALRRVGCRVRWADSLDADSLAEVFESALEAVVDLGAAEEGDKTMVDALAPAARAFRAEVLKGAGIGEALSAAREASQEGMRATVPLRARKGRASYLGERSVGHQDPGATSTALVIGALAEAYAA